MAWRGAAEVFTVVALIGCGGGSEQTNSAESSGATAEPSPDSTVAQTTSSTEEEASTSTTTPVTAPPSPTLTFQLTDSQGYTYEGSASGIGIEESITNAPPGRKDFWVSEGSLELSNTTSGRAAPSISSIEVVLAIDTGCASGIAPPCIDGFSVFPFPLLNQSGDAQLGVGDTATFLPRPNADFDSKTVDESLDVSSFYWTVRLPNGSDDLVGGWIAAGSPTGRTPTFTLYDFSG